MTSVQGQTPPAGGDAPNQNPGVEGLSSTEVELWGSALFGPAEERVTLVIEGFGTVGVPAGGCLGQAHEMVVGSYVEVQRLEYEIQALYLESLDRSRATDNVEAAFARWSECLHERGFEASSFEELDEITSRSPDDGQIVAANVECNLESDLAATWSHEEAEIQARLLEERPDFLLRVDEILSR